MAVVGRIARAHGIRGQVIVNSDTDFPDERYRIGAELFARNPDGTVRTLTVTSVRIHQGRPVIGLDGIGDMNAAAALAGVELRVPIEQLTPLPAGTFYRHDLVGCTVSTVDGTLVGEVAEVQGSAGDSQLVVRAAAGEVLIPLVGAICTTIDPVGRRIVVAPPEGLLEVNLPGAGRTRSRDE